MQYKDVLLNITGGGSIGRCCLFDKRERANVNQHVCIIRTIKEKILPVYLRYFWNSACGPVVVEKFQTGGNRAGLNFEQIGSVKIPWPSAEEQQRIVTYLNLQCSEIDQLIREKEALISDLESYKKSLIYEVVTGKRKVA
ncbi:MAG: restriction endonuclease subunit S [Desulfovibrionaceae bacterium]|nr:restriction endonuclease subunit S [Desulfovibrionaceae bacterium]